MELLRAAGEEVRLEFYQAMIRDLGKDRVPDNWRTVLYVLLYKDGAHPEAVDKRREIALMAQDMRLLVRVVRDTAYRRLTVRVVIEQGGRVGGERHGLATGVRGGDSVRRRARLSASICRSASDCLGDRLRGLRRLTVFRWRDRGLWERLRSR